MQPLLDIRDLKVEFETCAGLVQAVRGVSLSVYPGEVLALVGESGCGKSVTAQSIVGLIPSPPGRISGGTIYFAGQNMVGKSEKHLQEVRGRDIGFIFQDPMTSLNPTMKVGRQVTEVMRRHGKTGHRENRAWAEDLFRMVGFPNPGLRMDQYPHQFSGGMRQRVMIAMALACSPRLLIADEPTTAVDVTIQAQIVELMKDLRKKTDMAVFLITHDLALVGNFAQRVAVMYAGKIVETGPAGEIISHPLHPYTKGLLASLPGIGAAPGERLAAIPGRPPALINPPPGCQFRPRCPGAMNICARIEPGETTFGEGRKVACWLVHPVAAEKCPERIM